MNDDVARSTGATAGADEPSTDQPAADAARGRRPSRRALLAGSAGTAVALAAMGADRAAAAPVGPAAGPRATRPARTQPVRHPGGEFVTTRGGTFRIGRSTFRFGGTNTYYLHQQSHYMIDAALGDAQAMGLSVVRAWAFADGSGQSFTALQPNPYEYDDDAFDPLDYAIYRAGQLGLRLVLTLTNNWPDYGGMQAYVRWFLDLPDDSYADAVNHDRFYTTKSIKDCYKAWAKHVVRRRNPYTGRRYSADPTIMTFELANEPRNRSDKSGATILAWADEMSRYLKTLAPQHLVAVGDEGFYGQKGNADYPYSDYEGNHWRQLTALPAVDYGTVHCYPQHWGDAASADPVRWGSTWINDHLTDAARLRKPVVIEEYGLNVTSGTPVPDEQARTEGYRAWTKVVEDKGAGDQFWLLTSRVDDGSFYPDYDGFRVIWGDADWNPTRDTAKVLSSHAKAMSTAR